jgi:hypothetical protein
VVRIHINAATFAPIAQAPATPPRAAEAADFSTISRKDNCFFAGAIDVSLLLMIKNDIRALFVSFNRNFIPIHYTLPFNTSNHENGEY